MTMKSEICESKIKIRHHILPESVLFSPGVVQQARNNVCLLIDPASPNWVSTNMLGSAIIRRCDGRRTLREVTEWAGIEYGLNSDDTLDFIENAAQAGFVSTAPDTTPGYLGRSMVIAPAALEELWIYTNNSCPLRCEHCLVDGGIDNVVPMTTVEIRNLVDEALALGATRIYFTGGEPFLRKDLLDLVEYITSRVRLVILTSGVLVTKNIAQQLKALSGDNLMVQVSLEGPDAETNDIIRGDGSFDRALAGIKELIGVGIIPIISTTLTKLNYVRAPDTTRFLAALGIKDHHIIWLHECGRMRSSSADLILSGEEIAQTMEQLRETAGEVNIVVDNAESLSVRVKGRGHKNDLCNSCYGVLAVNTDGHIYPCASLVGAPEFDCGSIRDKRLRDIWLTSTKTEWVRANSVQKKAGCSTCYLKFFCGGGCFAQSYYCYETAHGTGCIMAPDPYCDVYRSQLLELIWASAMSVSAETNEQIPRIYRQMTENLPQCAGAKYTILDAAHDVGTYHCSCVLAMDVHT
jgi:radical SAM protein with 4Fe4S-binding SPASM domain